MLTDWFCNESKNFPIFPENCLKNSKNRRVGACPCPPKEKVPTLKLAVYFSQILHENKKVHPRRIPSVACSTPILAEGCLIWVPPASTRVPPGKDMGPDAGMGPGTRDWYTPKKGHGNRGWEGTWNQIPPSGYPQPGLWRDLRPETGVSPMWTDKQVEIITFPHPSDAACHEKKIGQEEAVGGGGGVWSWQSAFDLPIDCAQDHNYLSCIRSTDLRNSECKRFKMRDNRSVTTLGYGVWN